MYLPVIPVRLQFTLGESALGTPCGLQSCPRRGGEQENSFVLQYSNRGRSARRRSLQDTRLTLVVGRARNDHDFMKDLGCMNTNKERPNFDPGTSKRVQHTSRSQYALYLYINSTTLLN
jgi:hypothetical protein